MWETLWTSLLIVSTLESRSRGLGSIPGHVNTFCSWARHFTLTVHLSAQNANGTGEFSGKPGEMLRGNHVMN